MWRHYGRTHPRMFLSGVQFRTYLDSRLNHTGMTDFGSVIDVASRGESTHRLNEPKSFNAFNLSIRRDPRL